MEQAYLELLNGRQYEALENLAKQQVSNSPDAMSVLMIAHSRIRRGLFDGGIDALNMLGDVDPSKRPFAHDIACMCARELEQQGLESGDASERERLDDMDLWRDRTAAAAVRGQLTLDDGRRSDFADMEDVDAALGRRLLVFGLDRPWRIPFEAIAEVELGPKRAFFFDDLWVPVRVDLKPGEAMKQIAARVPALYKGSLGDPDPHVASGRVTRMESSSPIGLRDYRVSVGDRQRLIGIHQIRAIAFRTSRTDQVVEA